MKHPQQNQPQVPAEFYQQQNDGIDLKELFAALWQGKWIIIACTFVCTALAIAYALTAKQEWSSTATIASPKLEDISDYQSKISQFKPLVENLPKVTALLDSYEEGDYFYNKFQNEFHLTENKKDFLEASPIFQQAKSEKITSESTFREINKFYRDWYEQLTLSNNDDKENPRTVIKASAETSEQSLTLLTQYVDFINNKVKAEAVEDITTIVEQQKEQLKLSLSIAQSEVKSDIETRWKKSEYALEVARDAGIEAPLENMNTNGDVFGVGLGAKALESQVKLLKNLKDLSVFEASINKQKARLALLDKAGVPGSIELKAYSYIDAPMQEPSRDKPKRSLIAIIGFLIGGIIGFFLVFIRLAISTEKDVD